MRAPIAAPPSPAPPLDEDPFEQPNYVDPFQVDPVSPVVAPVNFNQLVVNPLTGEMIEVGSEPYDQLVNPLVPGRPGAFVNVGGTMQMATTATVLTITWIAGYNGEGASERNVDVDVVTELQRLQILNLLIAARDGYPQEDMEALLRLLRGALMETTIESFLVNHMVGFSYAGLSFEMPGLPTPGLTLSPNAVPADFAQVPINDNMPLLLPFKNIDLNTGPNEACVDRFLDMDLEEAPQLRNVDGMMSLSAIFDFNLHLFDMFGNIMAENVIPNITKEFRGLVFNGHVYPVRGKRPMFKKRPIQKYQVASSVYQLIQNTGAALYSINNAFLVGTSGMFVPAPRAREDWMTEMIEKFPEAQGWDPPTMKIVKRSALPLYKVHPDVMETLDPAEHITFDLSKCYYHVLRATLKNSIRVDRPSIFARWKPAIHTDVRGSYYYKCEFDQAKFGFQTDVIQGRMVEMLRVAGHTVKIVAELKFEGPCSFTLARKNELLKFLDDLSEEQRKKVAIVNGLMGRINTKDRVTLKIDDDAERLYYVERYNAEEDLNYVMLERDAFDLVNRLQWHTHVVHYASYVVLYKAFEVRAATGAWPVKIKTDSLTYRVRDLRTPFNMDGAARVRGIFDANPDFPWHEEEIVPSMTPSYPGPPRQLDLSPVYDIPPYENTTYIGPPGVGKTYTALHNHKIDLAICFSNKGARRINGKTIHSAMKIWGQDSKLQPDLSGLRNMTVFVDEFQAASRSLIVFMLQAYHEQGTRFVFAMDPNQIPPVGERTIIVSDHPFMGEVKYLTHDYRNDQELVFARQQVLRRVFHPDLLEWTQAPAILNRHITCISYLVETARQVNELIAGDMPFGNPDGKYIVTKASKKYKLLKSDKMRCTADGAWVRGDDTVFKFEDKHNPKDFIGWGFCVTIHKMLGETVTGKLAVFDWDHPYFDMQLQYTAITRAMRMRDVIFFKTPPRINRS